MRYNTIITEGLKSTALKRVRIKVDPAQITKECDISKCSGYEGYILAECTLTSSVLVLSPELSIEDIPNKFLEPIEDEEDMNITHDFLEFLNNDIEISNLAVDDPFKLSLIKCRSIDEIECILKQQGYTDDQVSKLYKEFIRHGAK